MITPNEELRKLVEAAIPAMVYEREYKNFEKSITPECVIALLDQLQSQAGRIAELEDRITELTSEENSIPELRQMIDDSYAEKQKCYFALSQHQLAYTNLLTERDELRAQLAGMTANTATDKHLVDLANDTATRLLKERDTLRVQLAAIAASEPYAYTHNHQWKLRQSESVIKMVKSFQPKYGFTFPLFTHPMPAESKDAERYRWLRDYLISPSTHFDDLIVSADKAETLNGVIDAAITKGAK